MKESIIKLAKATIELEHIDFVDLIKEGKKIRIVGKLNQCWLDWALYNTDVMPDVARHGLPPEWATYLRVKMNGLQKRA